MTDIKRYFWDVLFLKISTDPEGVAYARFMIDREEAGIGENITRLRKFNREQIDIPEVIVTARTDSTLSCRAFYEGEEDTPLEFTLDLGGSSAINITIGTKESPAWLGLEIVNIDDPVDLGGIDGLNGPDGLDEDDLPDDDGRFDAWV